LPLVTPRDAPSISLFRARVEQGIMAVPPFEDALRVPAAPAGGTHA